jgi:hypothetical protein
LIDEQLKLRKEEENANLDIPPSCNTISSTFVNTNRTNSTISQKAHQNISQKTTNSIDTEAATVLMGYQGVPKGDLNFCVPFHLYM